MSAMERSMMAVETGSSTGKDAKPNAPPNPPEAPTKNRCNVSEARFGRALAFCRGEASNVVTAARKAAMSAA